MQSDIYPEDVWRIFNLDIEYGKYKAQKTQIENFLKRLIALETEGGQQMRVEMDAYMHKVHFARNQRELRNFDMLVDFYKGYYQKELLDVMQKESSEAKKLPGQRRHFVSTAREQQLDLFSRRFVLRPQLFCENVKEDKFVYLPEVPQSLKLKELMGEYLEANADPEIQKKKEERYLQDTMLYAAVELWCQPDIRIKFKKHIYDYGKIVTTPTEKGEKELDLLHPSYRVKRVNKRICDFDQTDLFLDILQNVRLGLINLNIEIQ